MKNSKLKKHFDYIICGAGCAGLSLAYRLCKKPIGQKKILILDKAPKTANDRTWSFWSKGEVLFEDIAVKSWNQLCFYAPGYDFQGPLTPYTYHTIRGNTFYATCLKEIQAAPNVEFRQADVESISDEGKIARIITKQEELTADQVFDSTVQSFPIDHSLFVWQHFRGWEIKTNDETFNDQEITFMDFRVPQGGDIRFVYVLPWSSNTALVEATLFSKNFLEPEEYDEIIEDYIKSYLNIDSYVIEEIESGAIPMTSAKFKTASRCVIPIGTANGIVKASSGYAFTRIQKESDWIYRQLAKNGRLSRAYRPKLKGSLYDKTLLNVLLTNKMEGADVFKLMFEGNSVQSILKFLDEDTSLLEDMAIFSTLPFKPFLKGFIQENLLS